MPKKQLIIKAFEELDGDMLDVLLNDNASYQYVPKHIFIERLKDYFNDIKNSNDIYKDFKAYKGHCNGCQKGKMGYSFVNSQGECYMSLLFEETENDFSDIYKCSSFKTDKIEIVNEWLGIYFYEDEKTNFVHSSETLREERECIKAVAEINEEVKNNGILSSDFFIQWYENYKHYDSFKSGFNKKNYKYAAKIDSYIYGVGNVVTEIKQNELAKEYYLEFLQFPIVTEECIKEWLIKVDVEFQFMKYGFESDCNFRADYFETRYFKFQLSEIYYYHALSELMNKYFDWIREINPLLLIQKSEQQYFDDDALPF